MNKKTAFCSIIFILLITIIRARGVPTPNIDKIGNEGIRLTNFNVEFSCTPSRIAILRGWYATREGVLGGKSVTNRTVYTKGYR